MPLLSRSGEAACRPRCSSTAGGGGARELAALHRPAILSPHSFSRFLSPERRRDGSCCFTRCCLFPPQTEKSHTPPPEKRLRPNCCTVGHPSSFPSKETCKTPQTDGQWLFAPSGRPDIPTTAQTAKTAPVLGRFARVHRARDKVEHLLPLDAVSIVCFKPDITRYMARVSPVYTSSRTDTDH